MKSWLFFIHRCTEGYAVLNTKLVAALTFPAKAISIALAVSCLAVSEEAWSFRNNWWPIWHSCIISFSISTMFWSYALHWFTHSSLISLMLASDWLLYFLIRRPLTDKATSLALSIILLAKLIRTLTSFITRSRLSDRLFSVGFQIFINLIEKS